MRSYSVISRRKQRSDPSYITPHNAANNALEGLHFSQADQGFSPCSTSDADETGTICESADWRVTESTVTSGVAELDTFLITPDIGMAFDHCTVPQLESVQMERDEWHNTLVPANPMFRTLAETTYVRIKIVEAS